MLHSKDTAAEELRDDDPPESGARAKDVDAPSGPELAPRSLRLGAAFCDWMLVVAPFALALGWVFTGADMGFAIALASVSPAVCLIQWYFITKQGQTIGKRWQGIRIVRMNGAPVGFLRGVVLRAWLPAFLAWLNPVGKAFYWLGTGLETGLHSLSFTVPVFGIQVNYVFELVNVLFIFGVSRRCLHDHIAGTKVVLK